MNRISLLAVSPLALMIGATAAQANEPLTASIGGYMHAGVGLVDSDAYDGDVIILRDGEFHLKFKGVSDNGLTFDGRIELEAFGTEDYIDENWARVSGSFGAIMIGGNDTAKTELATGVLYAPGYKIGYYDDDAIQGFTGGIDGSGDQIGIHYYTPEIAGFQAAISYLPSTDTDGANDAQFAIRPEGTNVWSVGVNYARDFEGFGFNVSAGYESVETPTADNDSWSVGATVSNSGFTLAAYYEDNFDESNDYSVGLGYETGPWTFAGGWGHSEEDGSDDADTYAGWVSYALAPGVAVSGGAAYAEAGDDDAIIGLTWISLNF